MYALTEAAGYLGKRIEQRQEAAADNQQFDNTLLAAGNNDKERARIKAAYIGNSQEYGMKIDRESAVAYSNMIQGFRAQGKTLEEAIQLQKDQAAVFRIGNLDKNQQFSAALQLNQGYGKDRFTGSDLRPLTDALGTRLTTILYQAIGKALNYTGDSKKLAGFVLEAQHDGRVNGAMVQQGMRDIVAESPELLERHKRSLDAQAVRVENDQYLRSVGINEDPKLISALGERLDAERQLIQSTTSLQAAFRDFDVVLVKLQTSMLHMLAGKTAEGGDRTPQQRAAEVGAGYMIEGSGIDPFAINGKSGKPLTAQQQLDADSADPVSRMWRLLGVGRDLQQVAKDNRERWDKVGFDESHSPWDPRMPALDTSGLNTRALPDFGKHLEDLLSQSDPNNAVAKVAAQAVATASRATPGSRGEMVADDQSAKGGTTINNQTTVNAPPVEITVNVKTDASAAEIGAAVSGQVREEMQKTFQSYLPKEVQ